MQFKGMIFTRSQTITFEVRPFRNEKDKDGRGEWCFFRYRKTGKEILLAGHSMTNMAYAEDGRVLLVKNGQVWTSGRIRRTGAVMVPRG